jgi:L-ribulose-5-phosphate 3-epimerase
MKLSMSSQCFDRAISEGGLDLFDLVRKSREELGLEGLEIEDKHFRSTEPSFLEKLGNLAARYDLDIVEIAFFNNYGMSTREERERELERFKIWLEVSRFYGLSFMRVWAGWPKSQDPALWAEMIHCLRRSCALAADRGMILAMENENHGGFVKDAQSALRILKEVDADNLKLLVDMGNFVDGIVSIEKTIAYAAHVHAKFMEVDKQGNEPNIEYGRIFPLLRKVGYDGYVSVEYEGEEAEESAVPRAVQRIREFIGEE